MEAVGLQGEMDRLAQARMRCLRFGLLPLREAGFGAFYPCGFLEVAQLMIFPAQGTAEDHALDQLALLGHEVARWFAERGLVAFGIGQRMQQWTILRRSSTLSSVVG